MELKEYLKVIEKFLVDYLSSTHQKGYVLGLSGGVDSSLVALLAKKAVGKEKLKCLIIPIESDSSDVIDAQKIAEKFALDYKIVDATDVYREHLKVLEKSGITLSTASKSNLKVRIRMCLLYAYAQENGSLVLGTDNADERYTGYFTKYGDGGVDLLPIVHLLKREVVEASILLGLPKEYAYRVPSAGLFEGQTDEKEMGIFYKDLDAFLLGQPVDEATYKRIEHLHNVSEHKRTAIPSPAPFERK